MPRTSRMQHGADGRRIWDEPRGRPIGPRPMATRFVRPGVPRAGSRPPPGAHPAPRPYGEGSGPDASLRRGDAITDMKRHVFPPLVLIELAIAVAPVLLGPALPGRDDVRRRV